jgi:hypothetical protein
MLKSLLNSVVISGRASLDVFPASDTQVDVQDQGVTLVGQAGDEQFIPTRQAPRPGSKTEAETSLATLIGTGLVREPQLGGGAVNSSVQAAQLAGELVGPKVNVHLLVENNQNEFVAALGDRKGFGVGFCDLSEVPVNLGVPTAHDRIIVKSPLAMTASVSTLDSFRAFESTLQAATVVAFVSPASPMMVAAMMALGNGALRVAQPTGAMDLAATLLMLQVVDDLVVSDDDLLKLGKQTGCEVDLPGGETPAELVETSVRVLKHLHRQRHAGSRTAVVTLGKNGCLVADWRRNEIERIELEFHEPAPTKNGAGDAFLGAWIFFRALGYDPFEAARRATHKAVKFHGLTENQYNLKMTSL